MARKRLGDLLIEAGLITQEQLETALDEKQPWEKLGDVLLRESLITEQQLIEVLEYQLGIPQVNILQYPIEQEAVRLVPEDLAKRHNIMPLRIENGKLYVAMNDPMDYFTIEELRMATGFQISPVIATKAALYETVAKFYDLQGSLEEVMSDLAPQQQEEEDEGLADEESAIVRLVNQIIGNAVTRRASDVHFDPQETELKIRYRIDGVMHEERSLPKHMQNIIIARIKIMGKLNITENRVPQDGRIKLDVNFKAVDIRLSTLPAVYGEKVVMRILDLSSSLGTLDKVGFTESNMKKFQNMINRPNGIVLITGPTGSGKSSTLYGALNHLNSEEVNIITIEDPVEYRMKGINQVQVNEAIGMTFASGLRSILRQDPDIVMIGEIRDSETAQISIRAALTGHLALSTLHTNSAIAALSRLIDMGVEPFLISSSLAGIVAQRLVRRVCRDCVEVVEPTIREKEIFKEYGLEAGPIHRGKGCPSCSQTGYRGRLAIHEVLLLDDKIKRMINENESIDAIEDYATSLGMKYLIDDGLIKVLEGLTTTEEVLRVTSLD